MADWKDKLSSIVYSTNPDFDKNSDEELNNIENTAIDKIKQLLIVELDRKNRKGKSATIISGFDGTDEELKLLEKMLKKECGVGGSARGGEILIQGDFRDKILSILHREGYAKAKIIGR